MKGFNLNERLDHISYMFNVRTKNKAYENHIVNMIYCKVNNQELMPVTQQYVKDINDVRKYYFIDLYFPQINFGIEIDEIHHFNEENKINDLEREEYIKTAIECDIRRIPIYTNIDGKLKQRDYAEIVNDVDKIVEEINQRINSIGGVKWESNEDKKMQLLLGVNPKFDIKDNIYFNTINEILNIFNKRGFRRCYYVLNEKYYLWVPTLTIDFENNKIKEKFNTLLSEDNETITEISLKRDFPDYNKQENTKRIVFLRTKDIFGKNKIKFIGVYELTHYITPQKRIYKRVMSNINISELK
jgi:hypothetical protein